jgi:hypothetical protein
MTDYEGAATHVFDTTGWAAAAVCGPNGGNCVEINLGAPGVVGVRDGKRPTGPVLVFPSSRWHAFLAFTRAGLLDHP